VVEQTSLSGTISFFVDAKLQATKTMPRPITDCAERALEVGGPGLLNLVVYGKITQTELGEIMANGFMLNAVADGKKFLQPRCEQL